MSSGLSSKHLWKSQLTRWRLCEVWILQAKILKKEKWSTIIGRPVHFMKGPYTLCKLKSSGKRRMVENDEIQMLMKQGEWKWKKRNLNHLLFYYVQFICLFGLLLAERFYEYEREYTFGKSLVLWTFMTIKHVTIHLISTNIIRSLALIFACLTL